MSVDYADIRAAQYRVIDELGLPCTWTSAKDNTQTAAFKVGMRHIGSRDVELVNDYGLDSVIFTMKASDVTPEKFDSIVINGESYVLQSCQPIHIGGSVAFWKGIGRGE